MTRRSLLALALALALVAAIGGCSGDAAELDGPIDYRVTGGFSGQGDGTVLHIELDGTMSRPKAGGGTETTNLDPATVAALHDLVTSADFPTLAPMYTCNCEDDFVHDLSVHAGGDPRRVTAEFMAQVPDRLKRVLDELQQIAHAPHDWR